MKKILAVVLATCMLIAMVGCNENTQITRKDFTTVENLRDEFGYWRKDISLPITSEELMNETANFLFTCAHGFPKEAQLAMAGVFINRTLSNDWGENLGLNWLVDGDAAKIAEGVNFYAFWHEGEELPDAAKPYEELISYACSYADVAVYEGFEPYNFSNFAPVFYVALSRPSSGSWEQIGGVWFANNDQ